MEIGVKPAQATIDLDATLPGSHSEKEGAGGDFKGGFDFYPTARLPRRLGGCREGRIRYSVG